MLGVGIGTLRTTEFGGFGEVEDLATHGSMLDEGLELIEALWSGEKIHHEGPHYRVQESDSGPLLSKALCRSGWQRSGRTASP